VRWSEGALTETAELQAEVDLAIKDVKEKYRKAIETVAILKRKIDDLERGTIGEGCAEADANIEELDSTVEKLDEFIDSVILSSARVKAKCDELEHECRSLESEAVSLGELKTLCQEYEHLAKDLLCYSLGRFEPSHRS